MREVGGAGSMAANSEHVAVSVRTRLALLTADGPVAFERSTFCPKRQRTVGLSVCQTCPNFRALATRGRNSAILCGSEDVSLLAERQACIHQLDDRTGAHLLKVGDAMALRSACVAPDVELRAVRQFLADVGTDAAVVVDRNGAVMGVLTPHEMLRGCDAALAAEVMVPMEHALREDCPLAHAVAMMAGQRLSLVPIEDASGVVIGCIGAEDALAFFARRWGYQVDDASANGVPIDAAG